MVEEKKSLEDEYVEKKMAFLETYIQLKRLCDILYDTQEERKRTANRERGMPMEVEGLYSGQLKAIEEDLTERIKRLLEVVPEYENVFAGIKGIGPRLGGSWIGNVMIKFITVKPGDLEKYNEIQRRFAQKTKNGRYLVPTIRGISAFESVSDMWSWCGQLPGIHRVRAKGDERGGWAMWDAKAGKMKAVKINPKMQTLCWKTSGQFVRSRVKTEVFYGKVYETHKEWISKKTVYAMALENPRACPRFEECTEKLKRAAARLGREAKKYPCMKHVDNMARRATVKDFIRDIYVKWRTSEGLPVPAPYDPNHKHHEA